MQYVSDRLFTKVSGPVGDAALTYLGIGHAPTVLATTLTPNVKATDAEGRELVHMDRSARAARKKGVQYSGAVGALGGALGGAYLGTAFGGNARHAVLGGLGLGLLSGALGAGSGAIVAPAMKRTVIRAKRDPYYRDPGKPLGRGGIVLPRG